MANNQSKSPTKRKSAKNSAQRKNVPERMSPPPSVRAKPPKSTSWQEEAQNIWRTITALQYGKVGWPFGVVIIGGMFVYLMVEIWQLKVQNALLQEQNRQIMEELHEAEERAEERDEDAQRRDMEMMHILLDFSTRLPPPPTSLK